MTVIDYSEERYYRHTGRAPIIGTTLAALAAWAAAVALAVMYGYADLYLKVADILSAFITILFAAAGGFAVYGVLRWARVRNLPIAVLVAVTAAMLLFYGSWVVWESALAQRAGATSVGWVPWRLFQRPWAVWRVAQHINATGTFTLNGSDVTGVELWLFWAGEALLLIGATIAIPIAMLRKAAFCETCGAWCRTSKDIVRVQHFDEELVREHLEAKDFEYLIRLGPASKITPVHFKVDLQHCPRCKETNLLTVSRVKVSYYNGRPIETAKAVVDRLWIDAAQAEAVRALPKLLTAKAQVAPPPQEQEMPGSAETPGSTETPT